MPDGLCDDWLARRAFELGQGELIEIGWGSAPRQIRVPLGSRCLHPPHVVAGGEAAQYVSRAIETPIGSRSLSALIRSAKRVCVLVPDETRKDVFSVIWPILQPMLSDVDYAIGIATGKHGYIPPARGRWRHDAKAADLIFCGTTSHGTVVRYPPQVIHADLRILLGEIRPHYFAGYSGGAKTLFPGVAGTEGIWKNHELKASPGARLGQVDGNPCRQDMEEAAALVGPSYIINLIRGNDGSVVDAVSGAVVEAHREGVHRARPVFESIVHRRAGTVIVSDRNPVTMNLYQACKLLPPAGAILKDGGRIILAAECGAELGPVSVINEAIYRLGSIHSLPQRHEVILVSSRTQSEVEPTFARYAESVEDCLADCTGDDVIVLPYGGDMIPRMASYIGGQR
ncbi:MAG: lactate racemase domain-containing protein [Myxococcota bacterium]|nr:lactate racemase domain-containing protein [Myxococcota bacterium]